MSTPDFAAILRAPYEWDENYRLENLIPAQLAAKVPELCQTCGGKGTIRNPRELGPGMRVNTVTGVPCPDCPTVGRLLAIGAAVMSAEAGDPDDDPDIGERAIWEAGWNSAITHLRAVQP